MKKLLILSLASIYFASCGNTNEATTNDAHATHQAENVDPNAVLDPVCKMVKTDEWTESTVSHGETYYFCSPVCKEQFEKDPHKYLPDHNH